MAQFLGNCSFLEICEICACASRPEPGLPYPVLPNSSDDKITSQKPQQCSGVKANLCKYTTNLFQFALTSLYLIATTPDICYQISPSPHPPRWLMLRMCGRNVTEMCHVGWPPPHWGKHVATPAPISKYPAPAMFSFPAYQIPQFMTRSIITTGSFPAPS